MPIFSNTLTEKWNIDSSWERVQMKDQTSDGKEVFMRIMKWNYLKTILLCRWSAFLVQVFVAVFYGNNATLTNFQNRSYFPWIETAWSPAGATALHQIRNREIIKILQILIFLSYWWFYICLDAALFIVNSVTWANLKFFLSAVKYGKKSAEELLQM